MTSSTAAQSAQMQPAACSWRWFVSSEDNICSFLYRQSNNGAIILLLSLYHRGNEILETFKILFWDF